MFEKLFAEGKSWRSTIAGVIVFVGGVPAVLASAGLAIPVWLAVSGGIASLISVAFGFSQTKDKQVHSTEKEVIEATEEKNASKP